MTITTESATGGDMLEAQLKRGLASVFAAMLVTPLLAMRVHASAGGDLDGRWLGSLHIDGDAAPAPTSLLLGHADEANATLRIEGRHTCTLRHGRYVADGGAWRLTFTEASGGAACARLAQGTFVLRQGKAPRQLDLEIAQLGADGKEIVRRGSVTRYP
jgi:hypothetical protein